MAISCTSTLAAVGVDAPISLSAGGAAWSRAAPSVIDHEITGFDLLS
jgi:predicted nuclease with RNAse H fold